MFNEISPALRECVGFFAINFANNGRQYEQIDPDHFAAIGLADGWADFESDREAMEAELKKRGLKEEEIEYAMYLYDEGYDTGVFMSDYADEIYDEGGELIEEWD